MKTYASTKTVVKGLRASSRLILPKVYPLGASNETGVAVSAYGKGQLTGVLYTIPAHGEITVDFQLKLPCVTPESVQNLSNLIKSLLDASHKHSYKELEKTQASGGASLFFFFSFGVSASYSKTKETMDSWGLSEENQRTIVNAMMEIAQEVCEFNYSGTIYNRDYDYDVTGNFFGIVMDAVIQQNQYQHQLRFLAPSPYLETQDGDTLPSVGKLYELEN